MNKDLVEKEPVVQTKAVRQDTVKEHWIVRRMEGMKRDTYGLFVDGTRQPILKSKYETQLWRVADCHNDTL